MKPGVPGAVLNATQEACNAGANAPASVCMVRPLPGRLLNLRATPKSHRRSVGGSARSRSIFSGCESVSLKFEERSLQLRALMSLKMTFLL
jgi:hypothetical protein